MKIVWLLRCLVLLTVSWTISCQGEVSSSALVNSNGITPTVSRAEEYKSQSQNCNSWLKLVESLNNDSRSNFAKDGIAFFAGSSDFGAQFVLSSELVNDCDTNVQIGRFLWIKVLGLDEYSDSKFVETNSAVISFVINKVWDSSVFTSDGVREAKYGLLTYRPIKDKDISIVFSMLLRTKNLNSALLNAIIMRPIPQTGRDIRYRLGKKDLGATDPERVYLLVLNCQVSGSSEAIKQLTQFTLNYSLATQSRLAINYILRKFTEGHKVTVADVEKIGLPVDETEELLQISGASMTDN